MNHSNIKHAGEIVKIENNAIKVKIISASACSACHAKGACSASESTDKIIEVYSNESSKYTIGESVNVSMRKELGLKAVALGYLVPFIILLFSLFTLMNFTQNELLSGLLSIAIVIPYFILLYLFRNKLQKTFSFYIDKI